MQSWLDYQWIIWIIAWLWHKDNCARAVLLPLCALLSLWDTLAFMLEDIGSACCAVLASGPERKRTRYLTWHMLKLFVFEHSEAHLRGQER